MADVKPQIFSMGGSMSVYWSVGLDFGYPEFEGYAFFDDTERWRHYLISWAYRVSPKSSWMLSFPDITLVLT